MVDDIARAKWQRDNSPNQHPAKRALEIALADIESGKLDARHIIVCYVRGDEENGTGYYQSGDLPYHGGIGLLTRCIHLMNEGS